jgi:caa(3)-type oxidase subunit IV
MNAHATTTPGTAALGHEHPAPTTYMKVGVVLFILTALEVAAFELGYNHADAGLGALIHPIVIEILLVLSAAKFALVAMFYMHLKQDSRLFSGLFVFPIVIASLLIVALMLLFSYIHSLQL